MPQLDPVPVGVALDSAGAIESGALLYVYTAGTTTPVTTYQDAALTTAHAFPVVADSSGRFAEIYVAAGNYKLDLRDAEGSSLPGYPRDNISLTASGVTTGATYGRAIQLSDDYSDTDAWTIESSVGITARAQAYDSTTALFDDPFVLEFAGDASDATNKVESAASVATVTPGQELRVTVPIYATGSPTSTFEIGLEWYTSAGATISETVASYANADITTGQVLHASKLATAPATAAGVRVIGQRKTASVTGNWYMGAARLEIGVDGGFVTLTGTETLTNKTLTAPAVNTPTIDDPILTGYFRSEFVTVAYAATVNLNFDDGPFQELTLTGNVTFGAPTNDDEGKVIEARIWQDATGSRTWSFNAAFEFGAVGTPTATTTASKYDVIRFTARGSGEVEAVVLGQGFG